MSKLSSVEILGAGPGGLYTAILLRRAFPEVSVRVTERNSRDATFGFGVVFSDHALAELQTTDPDTHDLIFPEMEHWRDMEVATPNGTEIIDGMGYAAIGRLRLIELLATRAEELGTTLRFATEVDDLNTLDADLVIGADGFNSLVRQHMEARFAPSLDHFENHFAWFGASVPF